MITVYPQKTKANYKLGTTNFKLYNFNLSPVNLFYQPLISQGVYFLDEEESKHCAKVLRKQQGDSITLTDGKGFFYDAVITEADSRQCFFEIRNKIEEKPKKFSVHIAIAPTKNADRIEWFIEKSVEIGIDQITLLECKNSERSFIKTERLKKVAVSAMKQSIKARIPEITDPILFSGFIQSCEAEEKFIALVDYENPLHLKDVAKPNNSVLVMIGPEGDFTKEELDLAIRNDFVKVSLGASRLRTETAGLAACHIINLINS